MDGYKTIAQILILQYYHCLLGIATFEQYRK